MSISPISIAMETNVCVFCDTESSRRRDLNKYLDTKRLDAVKWEAEAKAEKQKSGKAESREVA